MIHHITGSQINEEINKENDKLKIINFYTEWSEICEEMTQILKEIDKKYYDLDIFKVNVEESQDTAMTYSINSLPTLLYFKDGIEIERNIGKDTFENICKTIDDLQTNC